MFRTIPLATTLALALTVALPGTATACPFCEAPSATFAEIVAQSDVVLVVRWTGGTKPDGESVGSTDYTVVRVLKTPQATFQPEDVVSLVRYRPGAEGELSMLTAYQGRKLEWDPPMPVTETTVKYILATPSPDRPATERLKFYIPYLEFPEDRIASDAYGEFANAKYEDIAKLADEFPTDRLLGWITSDETPPTRLGLYGLLVGLSGDDEDARRMAEVVFEPTTEFRLGIEGVMSGYLLLTGERGLERLEKAKFLDEDLRDADGKPVLDEDGEPKKVPFSETYAAMQALRFLWQYTEGVVPPERIKKSMRLLLDRPGLADLVIADLARWKDWSVTDRLVKLYGTEGYEAGAVKRAVIRYLMAAQRDKAPVDSSGNPGPHVARAKAGLDVLRKRDPEMVGEIERFYEILMGPSRTAPPMPEE